MKTAFKWLAIYSAVGVAEYAAELALRPYKFSVADLGSATLLWPARLYNWVKAGA